MIYLQLFGLAFIILHTISILFVTKISLAKRLFLAVWMMLFIFGVPIFYQYLPVIAFGAVCLLALGTYVALLFSQDIAFVKIRKSSTARSSMSRTTKRTYQPSKPSSGPSKVNQTAERKPAPAVEVMTQEEVKVVTPDVKPSYQTASSSEAMASYGQSYGRKQVQAVEPLADEQPVADFETDKKTETQELDSLVKDTLEQIDSLFSQDSLEAKHGQSGLGELEAIAASIRHEEGPTKPYTRTGSKSKKLAVENEFLDKMISEKQEELKRSKAEGTQVVDEEELLKEIEDILDSHTDEESAVTVPEVVPAPVMERNKEEFTLVPVAEQTIEIIKEKQEEDGLVSVEEQLGKELYFQFLMYECRELLAMEMYQEAVDYLKEILIDSYDKNLRKKALDLLEMIKVELYHPKLIESSRRDYKRLEGYKAL